MLYRFLAAQWLEDDEESLVTFLTLDHRKQYSTEDEVWYRKIASRQRGTIKCLVCSRVFRNGDVMFWSGRQGVPNRLRACLSCMTKACKR